MVTMISHSVEIPITRVVEEMVPDLNPRSFFIFIFIFIFKVVVFVSRYKTYM